MEDDLFVMLDTTLSSFFAGSVGGLLAATSPIDWLNSRQQAWLNSRHRRGSEVLVRKGLTSELKVSVSYLRVQK